MRPNNLTLCLFTTTKGHFNRTDIYQTTVNDLLSQIPAASWGAMKAHIKDSGEDSTGEMTRWLESKGFEITRSYGDWSHFSETHQQGYINDATLQIGEIKTPYTLWMEDDFLIRAYDRPLEYWLHEAVTMLEDDTELVQVRIARFTNEMDRINRLKAKHGLDVHAKPLYQDKVFLHGDWSCNPFIARTRDLRAALAFLNAVPSLPRHIEHGLGPCMRLISGVPHFPFACLNPARIRVGHLGTRTPEEADDLSKPLLAD